MDKIKECEKILDGMCILNEELTLANFNAHYGKSEMEKRFTRKPKNMYKDTDQDMSFIDFMRQTLAEEDIAECTEADRLFCRRMRPSTMSCSIHSLPHHK